MRRFAALVPLAQTEDIVFELNAWSITGRVIQGEGKQIWQRAARLEEHFIQLCTGFVLEMYSTLDYCLQLMRLKQCLFAGCFFYHY